MNHSKIPLRASPRAAFANPAAYAKPNALHRLLLLLIAGFCLGTTVLPAIAQDNEASQAERSSEPAERRAEDAVPAEIGEQDDASWRHRRSHRDHGRNHGNVIFHFHDDSTLAAGGTADAVVSIFGSSTSRGEVTDAVVSIFGNTRVEGPVGDAAVAVFGNTYIDSTVGNDVAAVFGNLELGPHAEIGGDAVTMGGKITRHPDAVVHGDITELSFGTSFTDAAWLRAWIDNCLAYARPLAFERELGWAWGVAFGFLLFYIVLALMFGGAVERCARTLETQPGQSVVASLLTVLVTPMLLALLVASIIGIVIVPFVGMVLFSAGLFGKAVVLAALGRRVTRFTGIGPLSHIAFAVFVGGLIVLGLYVVPVLGFIAYKLLGILGLGVVVYTVLLMLREKRATPTAPAATPPGGPGAPPAAAAGMETSEAAAAAAGAPAAQPAAPALDTAVLPRAGFWIRMGALLIDFILIGAITAIIDPTGGKPLLLLAIYGALMWKLRSTTVGGIVLGIKVVRRDGQPITWETAVVRALSCFLSLLPAGLGFLWIAFDQDKQAWHDKIAGTLVVRTPKGEALL